MDDLLEFNDVNEIRVQSLEPDSKISLEWQLDRKGSSDYSQAGKPFFTE